LKDGRALRTEMMINNPRDFYINRGLTHFSQLVELGRRFNRHLLEQERISQDCFVPLDEIRHLGQSTVTQKGQRASALRFGDQRVMALLAALARFANIPSPVTNKTLRQSVGQALGVPPETYSSAKMSYDLRRLRFKGLIERIPNSHRYVLTALGIKVATFFTKLYERLFRPGLAALIPDQPCPSDLAQALNTLTDIIQSWMDKALLFPDMTLVQS
jgi:hypothetical protein